MIADKKYSSRSGDMGSKGGIAGVKYSNKGLVVNGHKRTSLRTPPAAIGGTRDNQAIVSKNVIQEGIVESEKADIFKSNQQRPQPELVAPCNAMCYDLLTIANQSVRADLFGEYNIVNYVVGTQQWLYFQSPTSYSIIEDTCTVVCSGNNNWYSFHPNQNKHCLNGEWSMCNARCQQSRAYFARGTRDCSGELEFQERPCSSYNCPVAVGEYIIEVKLKFSRKYAFVSRIQFEDLTNGLELMLRIRSANIHIEALSNWFSSSKEISIHIRVNRLMWLNRPPPNYQLLTANREVATAIISDLVDAEFLSKFGAIVNGVNGTRQGKWFVPSWVAIEKIYLKEVKKTGIAVSDSYLPSSQKRKNSIVLDTLLPSSELALRNPFDSKSHSNSQRKRHGNAAEIKNKVYSFPQSFMSYFLNNSGQIRINHGNSVWWLQSWSFFGHMLLTLIALCILIWFVALRRSRASIESNAVRTSSYKKTIRTQKATLVSGINNNNML